MPKSKKPTTGRTRKGMTPNQTAYQREVRRLKDGLRKAEKRGFIIDYNLIPAMPKVVTQKALREIKSLKPRDIYIKGNWVDFETGEVITAKERIYHGKPKSLPDYDFDNYDWQEFYSNKQAEKIEESFREPPAGIKPQTKQDSSPEPDIMDFNDYIATIIYNYRLEIRELSPTMQKFFESWLNQMIQRFGEEDVANTIEGMAQSIREFIDESVYPSWQAAFEYMETFENKLAEQLGKYGKQWLADWKEELHQVYV